MKRLFSSMPFAVGMMLFSSTTLAVFMMLIACSPQKEACSPSALEVFTVACEEAILSAKSKQDAELIAAACLKAVDEWEACK
jgi:hypothetical protein